MPIAIKNAMEFLVKEHKLTRKFVDKLFIHFNSILTINTTIRVNKDNPLHSKHFNHRLMDKKHLDVYMMDFYR